jgi:hypothetical protein
MDSCLNANLNGLVQAMERIGDECVATASVYVNGTDGGSTTDYP